MEDNRNDQGPGKGVVVEDLLSENVWRALILTSAAAVILLSVYCLTHGITIIFMHLYYFPIVLLAYRYRYRGFVLATLLAIVYVGLVVTFQPGQAEVTGAFYRFAVFIGIAAVIAHLSERLAAAYSSQKEGLDIILNLQQFQESVITNANVWITVLAPDGTTIIVWNDAAEAISGYKRGEVLGKRTIWRALYPDKEYRQKVTREIQQIIGRDTYLENFETEIRCADGTKKAIVWNTRGIRDPTGTIQSYIAIGRDITERKRAEEALQAQTNLLTSLINSSSDFIIFSLDREYRYLAFNEKHRKEMQRVWKTDIRIGLSILDCMTDPVLRRAAQESIDRALRGKAFTEVQHQPDPDIWYEFNWNPIRQSTVDIMGVSVFIQDITERKRAEEALQESETLLNEVGGMAHVGGWELDVGTKAVHWTKETYRIHDISENEKFDLSKAVLFFDLPDRSTLEAALQRCMVKGEPFDLELPFTSATGRHLWTRAIGRAVNVGGEVVKLTGTFQDITEHRQAEEALRESEHKFRDLFENSRDGIVIAESATQKFIDNNETFSRMLGYNPEEIKNLGVRDIHPEDSLPHAFEVFEKMVRHETNVAENILVKRKDGTLFYADISMYPLSISNKGYLVGVFRDITERKLVEEALRDSQNRSAMLLEAIPDMMFIVSRDGVYRDFSVSDTSVLAVPVDQIIGTNIRDSGFKKESTDAIIHYIGLTLDTKKLQQFEYELVVPDGEHRYEARMVALSEDSVLGIVRDITERKRADELIRESEERYRTLSESSPDQIFIIGRDDTMKYANAAALKLFRIPYDEVVGKPRKDLFPPGIAKSQEASLKKVFETGEHVRKLESIQFGKQELWIDTSLVPLKDEAGSVTSVLGIARDITEHKQAEEKLKFSNVLLATQQEVSIDGILVVDESGKIISFNRRFIEIWGVPQDVIASRSDERVLQSVIGKLANPEEFIERVNYLYANRDEKSREEIALKDGRVLDRYSAPMSGSDGKYYGRVWYFRDITEHKQAEEALQESEEKYREFFTTSRDCVFITSPGGQWIDFNDVALEMFGYASREELSKVPVSQLYENPSERTAFLNSIIRQGYAKEFPARLRRKDGAVIDTLITTVPVKNPDGSPRAFVGTIRDITGRKQAEEKLKVSEGLYRALVETTGTGYVILDKDGKVLDANPEYVRLTGHHTLEEISGRSVIEWTAGYEKEKNADAVKKCARDGYIRNLEIDYVDSTGTIIPVEITATVVEIQGTIRILTLCRDITDRKRLEEALKESEERFRGITERISDLIIIVNSEGYTTFVSPSITSILGFPPESYIGKRAGPDIIHAEDVVKVGQAMERLNNGSLGEQVEFRMSKSDGSCAVFEGKGIPIFTQGIYAGVQVIARDITERKRVEEALRETTGYLQNLFDYANAPIITWDPGFHITRFNHAFEHLTGRKQKEVLGKTLDLLFPDESRKASIALIQKTLEGERMQTVEIPILNIDGSIKTVLWNSANVLDPHGKLTATIAQGFDITDRKRAEEEIQLLNATLEQRVRDRTQELEHATETIRASLDEKVILLREIHHRVNNNLQILISLLNLQSRTMSDPQVIEALKESTQRIRAMSMVHEKLYRGSDLAHIEFVSYLSWLAKSQVSFYQLDPGKVTIETTGENILLDINIAIPLGLVMNELVSNALKHAFPGDRKGTIRIDAREKVDRRLEITFSDNGIGIPEGFDWKTAPSLGLQLVTILIDQLSGTIELDRTAGTTFTIVVKEKE